MSLITTINTNLQFNCFSNQYSITFTVESNTQDTLKFSAYGRNETTIPVTRHEIENLRLGYLPEIKYVITYAPYDKTNAYIEFAYFYILYGNFGDCHRAANNFILLKDKKFDPSLLKEFQRQCNASSKEDQLDNVYPLAYYLCEEKINA